MSNIVTRTVLNNGSKRTVLHVYLESDGVEGELNNVVLLDRFIYDSLTDSATEADMKLRVAQIWWGFSWFDGLISFDSLVPVPSWLLSRDTTNYVDFRYFGGIPDKLVPPNTSASTERTGKILLRTNGFAPLGSFGTVILDIQKDINP